MAQRLEQFSGVNCAGLIEASVRPVKKQHLCCFPALIAPASLKQMAPSSSSTAMTKFSGVNCAGLIEARNQVLRIASAQVFSGVNCAGLIEARNQVLRIASAQVFSGVNCAGLIEAMPLG